MRHSLSLLFSVALALSWLVQVSMAQPWGAIRPVQPVNPPKQNKRWGAIRPVQPVNPPKQEKRWGAIRPVQPANPDGLRKQRTKRAHALHERATVCNGDSALCSRLYSNVTYIGAHNSYANGTLSSASGGVNQEKDVTAQLNDGIRLLQNQGHSANNTGASGINLCHSSCSIYDGGSLESYLAKVKTWVDANPNEVITLLFVNSDDLPVTQWASAFESTGLSSKVYQPSQAATSRDSWPTLGSLIDSGRTVVVFIDNSADTSTVPYILPEFQNIWENPYNQVSVPFSCSVDRIDSGASPENLMYLSNHYLDTQNNLLGFTFFTPDTAQITTTNSLDSLVSAADSCAAQHTSYPTFILVDFYDQGDGSVLRAAAQMNRVQYTGNVKAGSSSSGSSNSTSGAIAPALALAGSPSLLLAAAAGAAAALLVCLL